MSKPGAERDYIDAMIRDGNISPSPAMADATAYLPLDALHRGQDAPYFRRSRHQLPLRTATPFQPQGPQDGGTANDQCHVQPLRASWSAGFDLANALFSVAIAPCASIASTSAYIYPRVRTSTTDPQTPLWLRLVTHPPAHRHRRGHQGLPGHWLTAFPSPGTWKTTAWHRVYVYDHRTQRRRSSSADHMRTLHYVAIPTTYVIYQRHGYR